MDFPKEIQKFVDQNSYSQDTIGMSGMGVYLFDDMMLKIQETNAKSKNEVTMLKWLNGKYLFQI